MSASIIVRREHNGMVTIFTGVLGGPYLTLTAEEWEELKTIIASPDAP